MIFLLNIFPLFSLYLCFAKGEILKNPDFEDDFDDDWFCSGSCILERTDEDSYSGQYSGKVTGRWVHTVCIDFRFKVLIVRDKFTQIVPSCEKHSSYIQYLYC